MAEVGCHPYDSMLPIRGFTLLRVAGTEDGVSKFDCTGVPDTLMMRAVLAYRQAAPLLSHRASGLGGTGDEAAWAAENSTPGWGLTAHGHWDMWGPVCEENVPPSSFAPAADLYDVLTITDPETNDIRSCVKAYTWIADQWDENEPPGDTTGTGSGSGSGGSTTPESIAFTGPDTVHVGELTTYLGTVTYADGGTSPGSSWFTSNAAVLRYDGGGKFMPLTVGAVTVTDSILGLNIKASKLVTILPLIGDDDESEEFGPDCTRRPFRDSVVKDFCTRADSTFSSADSTKIRDAIARIRAKGGVCDSIGRVLDSVFSRPYDIRLFTPPPGVKYSGGSPTGGFGDGWILLGRQWLDTHYDASHAENVGGKKRTLQSELAHEGDHLMDHNMPPGARKDDRGTHTPDKAFTANSVRCSEFGAGG